LLDSLNQRESQDTPYSNRCRYYEIYGVLFVSPESSDRYRSSWLL